MKEELRNKYRILRRYFSGVRREEADRAIAECLLAAFSGYDSFFIYNSFGTEADTHAIIQQLLSLGKKVYLPRVEGEDIVPVPFGKCRRSVFGVDEPVGEPFEGVPQVTVVPLLAVNVQGFRLGYGKGYYDRYLKDAATLKVGIGYAFQLTDELSPDRWDEPLDMFMCERGIYRFD